MNKKEKQSKKKKNDEELEDYSKGVQSRIAKLTRKMREAERREQAALDYAKGVEEKRQILEKGLKKLMLIMLRNLRLVLVQV